MKYNTDIWISFNYGGWSIRFSKEFDLPFVPFIGMSLMDKINGKENQIEFANHDYCKTDICYEHTDNKFIISVRNAWKRPVSDETIDDIIEIFTDTEWIREDNTDIKDLKNLMLRESERFK